MNGLGKELCDRVVVCVVSGEGDGRTCELYVCLFGLLNPVLVTDVAISGWGWEEVGGRLCAVDVVDGVCGCIEGWGREGEGEWLRDL